ncbi:MAG: phytanoyl-CoA dioxygenase family protein [Rhodospirillales bacterium]|nr:phytanoyl-CoA dioxygenase family protein [Rhodospirillales bacterium]
MTPEAVLTHQARVLSQGQRESYFSKGYVVVEAMFGPGELAAIRTVVHEFIERSKQETCSGEVFDLAPGHSADSPRLRRLRRPHQHHPLFWKIASGVLADVAADLVGPDVVFHHSKLNFKWNDGHDQVDWHQDIQFYPNSNYSPVTIGLLL